MIINQKINKWIGLTKQIGTGIKSVAALSAWKIPLISQRTWGPLVHMDSWSALMLHSGPIIKTPLRQPPLAIYTKRKQLHNCTIKADAQHFSEEDEISHSSVGALRALQHGRAPLLSKQWRGVTTLQCGQASWRVAQQSWFVNTASCFRVICPEVALKMGRRCGLTGVVTSSKEKSYRMCFIK